MQVQFMFKQLKGGKCEFSYEEVCTDDPAVVRSTVERFGPTLDALGLTVSVSEDGRRLKISGVCDPSYVADLLVSEFLPMSNAARVPLGEIWKGLVKSSETELAPGNGLSDHAIRTLLNGGG